MPAWISHLRAAQSLHSGSGLSLGGDNDTSRGRVCMKDRGWDAGRAKEEAAEEAPMWGCVRGDSPRK